MSNKNLKCVQNVSLKHTLET